MSGPTAMVFCEMLARELAPILDRLTPLMGDDTAPADKGRDLMAALYEARAHLLAFEAQLIDRSKVAA